MNGLADFTNANTKTLKLNIAHVYDMLWFTDPTCKIYRPEKMAGKIDWK